MPGATLTNVQPLSAFLRTNHLYGSNLVAVNFYAGGVEHFGSMRLDDLQALLQTNTYFTGTPTLLGNAMATLVGVTNAITSLGVTNFFKTNSGAGRYLRVQTQPAIDAAIGGGNYQAMEFWSSGQEILETNTPFCFMTIGYDPISDDALGGELIFRGTANHGDINGTQSYGDIGGIHFMKANMDDPEQRLFVMRVRDPVAGSGNGGGYFQLLVRLTNDSGFNEVFTANQDGNVCIGQYGQGAVFKGHVNIPANPGTATLPLIYLQHKTLIANPQSDGIENNGVNLFFTQKVGTSTNRYALASFNDVTNLYNAFATNGVTSMATNATKTVAVSGFTNTLTVAYRLMGLTGTSIVQTNPITTLGFSRGTITVPQDIVLQPNEFIRGSSIAAQGVQAF